MMVNSSICVLIAAAGKGSRSGLSYPKTLYKVEGKAILLRLMDAMSTYDNSPTIIVSPTGKAPIRDHLKTNNRDAHIVVQEKPIGMGDAVLRFIESPAEKKAEDIILAWGDIPFIEKKTVSAMVKTHMHNQNVFTFVTRRVNSAYTIVCRNQNGQISKVLETREEGINPEAGERDIGLFIFRKSIIFDLLSKKLDGQISNSTKEHGFLYIIKHLVDMGYRVEGLPIAEQKELVSLNKIQDLEY